MNYLKKRKQVKRSYVRELYVENRSKIGQLKVKTKIYQTIKGLIILFIKLQFSHQMEQAFRPLCISTSNFNLNFNNLVICIISNKSLS